MLHAISAKRYLCSEQTRSKVLKGSLTCTVLLGARTAHDGPKLIDQHRAAVMSCITCLGPFWEQETFEEVKEKAKKKLLSVYAPTTQWSIGLWLYNIYSDVYVHASIGDNVLYNYNIILNFVLHFIHWCFPLIPIGHCLNANRYLSLS